MRNSSDEPMIYMVVQSKENSVGNYSTEDGLAEEKAKSLVGLDVTNDWSQESIEILFKLVLMYANREPYY